MLDVITHWLYNLNDNRWLLIWYKKLIVKICIELEYQAGHCKGQIWTCFFYRFENIVSTHMCLPSPYIRPHSTYMCQYTFSSTDDIVNNRTITDRLMGHTFCNFKEICDYQRGAAGCLTVSRSILLFAKWTLQNYCYAWFQWGYVGGDQVVTLCWRTWGMSE